MPTPAAVIIILYTTNLLRYAHGGSYWDDRGVFWKQNYYKCVKYWWSK